MSQLPDFDPDYSGELPDFDPDFGLESQSPKKPSAGVVGDAVMRVGDAAIALGKGVVGVPQLAVGLADLATGGRAGKSVEDVGVRFKDTQDILSGLQSPAQKEANRKVAEADGFVDTLGAAVENPSTIVNATAESLPAMGLGGLIARGGLAGIGALSKTAAEKAAPILAGVGEGLVTAGQSAEQLRSDNPSGLLSGKEAVASAASGAITGAIGAAAGRLAQKFGIADIDTLIAKGGPDAVTAKAAKTGFLKAMAQSGFSEGVLEELPQSAQEQMWQNWAQGKPIAEGVGNQAAMGMLAGAAMGGAGGGYNAIAGRQEVDQPAQPEQAAAETPEYRPMSGQDVPLDVGTPEAAPVIPEAGPDISSQAPGVEAAIGRLSELEMLADQRDLTPQEQGEYQSLAQTINQETSDQPNQAGIEAKAAEPQAEPISEVQPAQSPVSAEPSQSQPIENQEVASEQGQNPAPQETAAAQEVANEAGASPQTIPAVGQNAVDQEPLQQQPVQQNPDVVAQDSPADTSIPVETKKAERIPRAAQEQVRKIDQRIADIESQIPTRSGPVQASLIRESDRLKQEREQLVAKKPTRFKPFSDPRLAGNEEVLNQMADQAGWAEVGGQLLRDAEGKPSGRTQWLPRADWYAELPKDARMNQADTIAAVNKAINGEPMSAKEKRAVSAMLDHIEYARDNERAPDLDFDEIDLEAADERQAIIEADQLAAEQTDEDLDAFLEATLNGGEKSGITDDELDDIFGPEQRQEAPALRSPEKTEPSGAAGRDTAGSGAPGQAETQQRRDRKPKAASGAEQGDQGSEQAGGSGSGLSVAGQKAAERFKENPQKVINNLTSVGRIKELHDAAGVMTSAGFKDLPMADKVAAYVKMTTGETIPGAKKTQGKPVETDLFVNSEEERKALEAKQGAADVAAAKDKKRQGDDAEPPALFSDNPAMAGQVDIEDAAHEAATSPKNDLPEPTQAQKEAGNYKKGHITLQGLDITIENPQGSTRSGVDSKGNAWSVKIAHHYGYIKRTEGADGDHVDVFIGPNPESQNVFVVNQTDPRTKQFDEHKVMLGFKTQEEARAGYLANYAKGWKGIGSITPMSMDDFKKELESGVLDKPIKQPSNTRPAEAKAFGKKTGDQSSTGQENYGKANKVFTEDAAAKARELLTSKLGTVRSGLDPEMIQAGITLAGYHIEAGAREFGQYAKAMIADLGEGIKPYLRSFYEGVRYYPGFDNAGMSTAEEIDNVSSTDSGLESDSGNAVDEDRANEKAVQPERNGDGQATGGRGGKTKGGRVRSGSNRGDSIDVAAAGRERVNQPVHSTEQPVVSSELAPGVDDSERGDAPGNSGIQSKPLPSAEVNRLSQPRNQKAAATRSVVLSDLDNIRATLPVLNPGQVQDVKFAEDRFAGHAGVLFTNSTGTGKTFSALGIIKRFALQDMDNVIIAVPSINIADQWRQAADKFFDLPISLLENTRDAGKGVVITTYANFGTNRSLVNRDWNLIVADESHKLMQNEAGDETDALKTLRGISYHPRGFYAWLDGAYPGVIDELKAARSDAEAFGKDDTMGQLYRAAQARVDKALNAYQAALKEGRERYEELQKTKNPKVLLLSATPFAYVKTVDYAEGYLFHYQTDVDSSGYNSGDDRERFFMSNFGYRMRYNKLTAPEANVDTSIMERQFNSMLKKSGALSFRMLDVPFDYDRKFQLVDNALGRRIDEAMEWIRTNKYRELAEELEDKFDHLQRRYLLEAIKAKEAIPIVKDHLAHGRKVVVFHDYKKGGATNPFLLRASGPGPLADQIREFNAKFKDIVSAFDYLPSPIAGMRAEFGDNLMVYNGSVPAKERIKLVEQFNDDDSGKNLILVQSASAKEGVSFHDTTGKHQRVLINLGLPTQPTTAIQQEGRIYRVGQQSDALFRYLNTGTNWERWAFATTIANRASTAENLGAGEGARALKDAFINGFESSDDYPAGYEGEGKGGKEADKAATSTLTEFERAKSFYFGQQKRTSRNKSAEGTDYFATPEPVGMKMAEWADIRTGDHALEPSAGHGPIARWFRDDAIRTAIEPSGELSSRLAMVFDGDIKRQNFEDLHIVNKYSAIVMNPPFGVGGKVAIEHLDKAFKHLPDNGRVVALIPQGPSADKRFDQWLYDNDATKHAHLIAEISLPNITFERAGTRVKTRIVIIDKITDPELAQGISTKSIDLDNAENIGELFDRIENISMPARKAPVVAEPEPAPTAWQGVKKANEQANQAAKEAEAKAQEAGVIAADASKATFELVGDKILTNAPAEQVTTKKGKVLDGVFVPDEKMAKAVDQFTYRPNGKEAGWFVRLRHIQRPTSEETRLSIGANTAPTPSLVDLFEKMGKRSSKSAPAEVDQHPKAALIRAVQDNWTDVLLQVGFENIDKSDNPNGKVFIQC